MELSKVENLLDKYDSADTTIAEENELKLYFSTSKIPLHLKQYQHLFGYYEQSKQEKYTGNLLFKASNQPKGWLSAAAAVLILFGTASYFMLTTKAKVVAQNDLGSYKNPSQAMAETQKALVLLSNHLNTGITSVHYISEYQKSKERVFKK